MKYIKQDFSSKVWVQSPGWTSVVGQSQYSTFSEYGHVANQIKGSVVCINMVVNILSKYPPPWGWDQNVKIQLFRTWSCCISLRE